MSLMVAGTKVTCSVCGTVWYIYPDIHDRMKLSRGRLAVGGRCPCCSTYRTIAVQERPVYYNVGNLKYSNEHRKLESHPMQYTSDRIPELGTSTKIFDPLHQSLLIKHKQHRIKKK